MEVKVIEWQEIHKDDWQNVLMLINIGDYIEALPYKVPDNLRSFRIPLSNYWNYKSEIPTMRMLEFEKVRVCDYAKHKSRIVFCRIH